MTGASRRQRIQALLFAAIMVVSMVAAGVGGLAGSAVADLTGVDGIEAEDVTSGVSVSQTVTLKNITANSSGISGQEVLLSIEENADVSIENASIEDYGQLNQTDTYLYSQQDAELGVALTSESDVKTNVTLDVTINTSAASGSAEYNVTTYNTDSAGPSTSFEISGTSTVDSGNKTDGVLSVGSDGEYDTIQTAIDNASSGTTIVVEDGIYEPVTINTDNLTIIGGDSVTVEGSGNGLLVAANDTTIEGTSITDFNNGIKTTENIRNLHLKDVKINNSSNGLQVSAAGSIQGLKIINSTFSRNNFGVYFAHPQPDDGNVTDVLIKGTEFNNHFNPEDSVDGKALYAETLSNATFNNVRVIDGEDGFDINLKAGDYGDITVRNSVFNNLDSEALKFKEYDGTGSDFGEGPNYQLGDVIVDNVTIAESYAAIWAYGYKQTDLNLTLRESNFTGNEYHLLIDPAAINASNLSTLIEDKSLNNDFTRAALVDSQPFVVYSGFERAFSEDEVGESDVVTVYNGTYEESVTVNVSNVTLRAADGTTPTIIGDGESVGTEPHAAIHVDDGSGPVQDVTIKGFNIENPNGKYGIFAGTGTTNKDPDGIGGLVIRDNVVQNISTNSTGRALTGGPAGIGIRADYGTDGNPGIEISGNDISNVENGDGPEPVGITLKSFTGNAGFGVNTSGDPVTDMSSPPATDTNIVNNRISDINSTSGGYATKGISFSGEFEDIDVINNSLTDIISPGSTAIAITFSENNKGNTPEDYKYDIDDDGNGERIGPRDFDVRNNKISQVSAPDARAVNIGGYEQLGNHSVTQNNINQGVVARYSGNQAGFDPSDADALKAQLNYWGDGLTPLAAGEVVYDPVLTTPAENVESKSVAEINEYGSVLELNNGDGERTLAVGFSAPPDANASEIFDDAGIEEGNAYTYRDNGYNQIAGSFTPETGEVIVFTTAEAIDRGIVVPIDTSVEGAAASPEPVDVENGWNLVATGAAAGIDDIPAALNGGTIQDSTQLQAQPRQPGLAGEPEGVGAFDATWIFVNGEGEIETGYSENQDPNRYSDEILYPDGQSPEAADIPDQTDESNGQDDS